MGPSDLEWHYYNCFLSQGEHGRGRKIKKVGTLGAERKKERLGSPAVHMTGEKSVQLDCFETPIQTMSIEPLGRK